MSIIKKLLAPLAAVAILLPLNNTAGAFVQSRGPEAQINCLAQNAFHEARGESRAGQIAVMSVVMNRTKDGRFPSNPCGVVFQRSGKGCQFSWVCSGRRNGPFAPMVPIAREVYNGQIRDNTGGAIYFHNRSVRPSWARPSKRTVTIGSHSFYRG